MSSEAQQHRKCCRGTAGNAWGKSTPEVQEIGVSSRTCLTCPQEIPCHACGRYAENVCLTLRKLPRKWARTPQTWARKHRTVRSRGVLGRLQPQESHPPTTFAASPGQRSTGSSGSPLHTWAEAGGSELCATNLCSKCGLRCLEVFSCLVTIVPTPYLGFSRWWPNFGDGFKMFENESTRKQPTFGDLT